MSKPLWVPLRAIHFDAFAAGQKDTEYRRADGPYGKLERLPVGRPVTLSRGYSGTRLHMVIESVTFVSAATVPDAAAIYGRRARLVAIKLRPQAPDVPRRDRPLHRSTRTRRTGDRP